MPLARDRVALTADTANATTSFADVTGSNFALVNARKYHVRGCFAVTGTATTGVAIGLNAAPTTAPTLMAVTTNGNLTATTSFTSCFTAFDTGTAGSDLIAAGTVVTLEGIIVPSADAIYVVRMKAETAVSTTVKAGSYIEWEQTG